MSEEQQENFEQTNGENFEEMAEQQQEAMEDQEPTEEGAGDAANDEDEDDRKLFVGNLSWETTQKDLKDYFSKYGEVTNCTLKTDLETKRSRGFAFVVFSSSTHLDKVLEEKEHKLHGRSIDPKKANPRKEVCKKIFCGKVDPSVPESDIKEYFSKFGEIDKVELPFDKVKDQRRAFCFVEFKNEESVKKVLEETAHKLNNVDIGHHLMLIVYINDPPFVPLSSRMQDMSGCKGAFVDTVWSDMRLMSRRLRLQTRVNEEVVVDGQEDTVAGVVVVEALEVEEVVVVITKELGIKATREVTKDTIIKVDIMAMEVMVDMATMTKIITKDMEIMAVDGVDMNNTLDMEVMIIVDHGDMTKNKVTAASSSVTSHYNVDYKKSDSSSFHCDF
ncbi:hypothetical protein KUTeg_003804 [Tegillarca granosa]|uniref:RRM domain-containing protein n=1 Tax=Tegillarca granosa TaxID=220873 RepID=A0ABQ9FN89_TEGGR|nr:hypothetical protein KUTeg_003804 [Tegillarca granosa]